ncbi:auxin response factor 8-like isoform X2 [Camellia sinensis]|uniref:auxin response factor 8-like isoform X2 n=1 Tax=Camellia sinensis TaxID=4442 RepID=UPI00103617E8|nr:auxin response factor 8-like isoform X2 [Camellia sinensis]XP_028098886.1 auxin response factor 8-like isoform X2 [Camellia sinensis]XP_028098887.1 auxin response factor 8-like isoform X2 [Camellia sinensis]
MRFSSAGFTQQSPKGEKRCLNCELWHACASPLVSLPAVGSRVVYFSQGHSEQGDNVPLPLTSFEATGFPSELLREVVSS